MTNLESILLISLAIALMIFQNLLFGIFNIYVIKEHDTTLQRLLNILYFLLALAIQVSYYSKTRLEAPSRVLRPFLINQSHRQKNWADRGTKLVAEQSW